MKLLLKNALIQAEDANIPNGYLLIEDGIISQFGPMTELPDIKDANILSLQETDYVVPGFIDLHIHGVGGADTMDATPEAIKTMTSFLPKEGTTSFLATTMTQSADSIEKALRNVNEYVSKGNPAGEAEILGIHLEGPFINVKMPGAQPKQYIIDPDIELFKKWNKLAGDSIKLVTLAPETEGGLEFVSYLSENNIVASLGHTNATFEEAKEAVSAGATHVTHLFNQMTGLHHRKPGVAGAALLLDQLKMELIVDGIHVNPDMVKLAIHAKGYDGTILITDSMRAKCLKNGTYDLGGQNVQVKDGEARLNDGALAGSILRMADSLKNVSHYTGANLREIVQMASTNPAKQLNVFERKGSIAVGKDADLVILSEDLTVQTTFCRGQLSYQRGEQA